jgi:hypothetical protein
MAQVPFWHQLPVQQSEVVWQDWPAIEHVGCLQMRPTQLKP